MEYLDKTGLTYLWSKLKDLFNSKQDTLESGVNIKTINGNSIVGSGNINTRSGGQYSDYTKTLYFGSHTIITGVKSCAHTSSTGAQSFDVSFSDYNVEFAYKPNIQLTITAGTAPGNYVMHLYATSVTTTGFKITIYSRSTSAATFQVMWAAIGDKV